MIVEKAGYQGFYLPELGVAMDGVHPDARFTFVTHAHADHMHRNSSVVTIGSAPTLDLMALRGFRGGRVALPFLEPVESGDLWEWMEEAGNVQNVQKLKGARVLKGTRVLRGARMSKESVEDPINPFRVTLYPAGHILGSAMVYIESELGSLLYTGDCRTPPSPATEGFSAPSSVDTLITEATFSLPIYRWEPHEVLASRVREFAEDALREDRTPVFLAYNLGKAQEIMQMLAPMDHPMMIHGAGFPLCEVYERYGFSLGRYETYRRESCEGKILIAPGSALGSGFASNVKRKRIAYCSGWATLEARQSQLTVDALIPLSDHLDFYALLEFVEQVSPKRTIVTHSPNADVVLHYLAEMGIHAEAGLSENGMNESELGNVGLGEAEVKVSENTKKGSG
jgi:putative mRNA 3-end processing factor